MSPVHAAALGTWAGIAFGSLLFVGRRQQRRGGTSWGRLAGVSLALSALSLAPPLAALWVASRTPALPPLPEALILYGPWLALGLIAHLRLLMFVDYPSRFDQVTFEPDPEVLARVEALARALRVRTPRVRTQRSSSGELSAQAYAFGLVSPCLLVLDGILERLDSDERDAILAHELAHHSTGSLWVLALLFSGVATLAVLATAWVSPALALLAALPTYLLLKACVWRRWETACDLAGARVVGFASMCRALDKIHAGHWAARRGWRSLAIYALASHPDEATRRAALARAAPPEEGAALEVNLQQVRQRRIAHAAAIALGSVWIAAALLAPRAADYPIPSLLVLTAIMLVILDGSRAARRIARQRLGRAGARNPGQVLTLAGLLLMVPGLPMIILPRAGIPTAFPWEVAGSGLLAAGCAVLVFGLARTKRALSLRRDVGAAFALGDYARVVELGRATPKVLARDPLMRHDVGLANALCGDTSAAQALLEGLSEVMPHSQFTLGLVLLHSAPEAALALGRALAARAPQDAACWALQARALLRVARWDEAHEAIERGLALNYESGSLHAIGALIDLGRGALEDARSRLEQASAHAPGEALTLYAAAKLATASGASSEDAIAAALRAARANPFAFVEQEVLELGLDRPGPGATDLAETTPA